VGPHPAAAAAAQHCQHLLLPKTLACVSCYHLRHHLLLWLLPQLSEQLPLQQPCQPSTF
jgi:hypothetical protein